MNELYKGKYANVINHICHKYGVSPELVTAIIKKEAK